MTDGIVLVALGDPIYGQMAFNLAMSLKSEDENVQIALFYSSSAIATLKKWHLPFFDSFHEVPESIYTVGITKQYQRAKLFVYEFSPFENTIYLDVDALWCPQRKACWLFAELKELEFTIGCCSFLDVQTKLFTKNKYTFWGKWQSIVDYHKLTDGKLWQTWSAFSYFKKTKKVKAMFDEAIRIYDDPGTPNLTWAGGKPDEYCFNIAMNLTGLNPHKENYLPIYNTFNGAKDEAVIKSNFWGFGTTGNKVREAEIKIYNSWVNSLCIKNDIPDRFFHIDKKEVIKERLRA